MAYYRLTLPVTFEVTETGDGSGAIGRASLLLCNYEVTDAELAGFNEVAGTNISLMTALSFSLRSEVVSEAKGVTVVHLAAEIEVELEADDEASARNIAGDALELFNFCPAFLAGYNSRAGTGFTGFSFESVEPGDIEDITDDTLLAA